jgi:hypothetical protein
MAISVLSCANAVVLGHGPVREVVMGAVGAMKWWKLEQIEADLDRLPIILKPRVFWWIWNQDYYILRYEVLPHIHRTRRGKARRKTVARIMEVTQNMVAMSRVALKPPGPANHHCASPRAYEKSMSKLQKWKRRTGREINRLKRKVKP